MPSSSASPHSHSCPSYLLPLRPLTLPMARAGEPEIPEVSNRSGQVTRVGLHLGLVPLLCWVSRLWRAGRSQHGAFLSSTLVLGCLPLPRGPSWPRASTLTQTIQVLSSSPSALTASALAVILQGGASVDCAPSPEGPKVTRTAPGPTSKSWVQVPARVHLALELLESVGLIFLLCSSSRDGKKGHCWKRDLGAHR